MVRHQPLQYYEPQLCLSCLTGIYGCRWKRYQRSHDDTTPVSHPGSFRGTQQAPASSGPREMGVLAVSLLGHSGQGNDLSGFVSSSINWAHSNT